MNKPAPARQAGPQLPWWRVGMVWLAIGGPAVVVVAATVTAVIAMHGADPVVLRPRAAASPTDAAAPALQARNHAATAGAAVEK